MPDQQPKPSDKSSSKPAKLAVKSGRLGKLAPLLDQLSRDEDWVILINADPDAMAAALALKRIFARRTGEVVIARINEVRRPDNLAMVRYLQIPVIKWDDTLLCMFSRFALVDSQPHHSPQFAHVPFSVVIDHHPLPTPTSGTHVLSGTPVTSGPPTTPVPPAPPVPQRRPAYTDIRPNMGATSTMLTEYLRALGIRPGALLATALQYGIRTDTASFTRHATEHEMRAYLYLSKYADPTLLLRIMRSEYLPAWLPYFSRAFSSLHVCGKGGYTFLDMVENPDILVVVADFFTRVHGLAWIAVCGVCNGTVVVIFRGDGRTDLGRFSSDRLGELGSAGGHRAMARAEFPLSATEGRNVEVFVFKKLFRK